MEAIQPDQTTGMPLPPGYDEADARRDRRDLATLRAKDVNWRVRRRLRHRVGGEALLLERLAAWDGTHAPAPVPAPEPPEPVIAVELDAGELAATYRRVCASMYGADDPEVLANAAAIASGTVAPAEARLAIEAERQRARELGVELVEDVESVTGAP